MKTAVLFFLSLAYWRPIQAAYEAFPSNEGPYVSYAVSPSTGDNWVGEDFESYSDGDTVECSNNKGAQDHLDVTSGCLKSKYAGSWRRGYTNDQVFRMVTISHDDQGREIKWTDQSMSYRAYITEFHNGTTPDWAGLHVFFRYRTSDDLYAASIRYDGKAVLKKKVGGAYATLASTTLDSSQLDGTTGKLKTGVWRTLKVSALGMSLKFYLDGAELLSVSSGTFSWGTTGIRTDYCNVYLDDIEMSDD